jgi:uncharacterized membrane protein YccC
MAFIDTLDLFERIMTSQQDYRVLHEAFDNTGLLPAFGNTILQLADDLQHVGIAFQEGKGLNADENSSGSVKALGDFFLEQRKALLTPQNSDAFIGLHQVLNSLKDVQHRIDTLHAYSSYDLAFRGSGRTEKELKRFVARSDYNPKLVVDNLNMHSNIFRHSLRVSLALVLGYLGAFWLPVGHDYWIMLTIIVILKPAYSLTRKRNIERLAGTVGGVIVAAFLLYTIHENAVLLSILMLSMIITYSLIRTRYLPSVVFMTIYIVIAFHLLKSGDTKSVLRDRLVDTAIGSAIAFATVFLLPPRWEHETILDLASDLVEANRNYFNYIAGAFSGETFLNNPYRLKRKATYVALANLGDAFQRMLNEPKSKQQKGEQLHQLIVSSHVLVSHIATLSAYRQQYGTDYGLPAFARVQETADLQFRAASDTLKLGQKAAGEETVNPEQVMEPVEWQASEAAQTKGLKPAVFKTIVDQFEIILRVSNDIKNIASALVS